MKTHAYWNETKTDACPNETKTKLDSPQPRRPAAKTAQDTIGMLS
jgi:hypothetical protein